MHRASRLLVASVAVGALLGCSSRKQVPFGLEDAEPAAEETTDEAVEAQALPVGETFGPDQVEIQIGESALVLQKGYALSALQIDLDGRDPLDAIVVSADPQEVRLQAAFQRGLTVAPRQIDSFLVPSHCRDPKAEVRQLSASLVSVQVEHECETGTRTNVWLLTVEPQPRVRERITVLPPNEDSSAPISIELAVEDRDADGYEDVVANVHIGEVEVPLAWLNRPGGFARDASQPEATFRLLADDAWAFLDSDRTGSEKRAQGVLDAFIALCRESGAARIGLAGTQGIQCQQSAAAARAVAVAMVAAIRRGTFVRALELQRWWNASGMLPTAEEQALVQSAWQKAKASARASWRVLDKVSSTAGLYFTDDDTLMIDGFSPKSIALSTGAVTHVPNTAMVPPTRSPNGRFSVRGVRVTCAGFEAEVGPVLGKRTHRVLIERRAGTVPCQTPVDRPASVFEWAVLGWAPQGLVAASGDLLRIVPLNELGKPAGQPLDLAPGSPLPAPIRGARITPDGGRYVIPHAEGVVVRDWRKGGAGLWLRPAEWDAVSGTLRAIAISPDGKRIAVQKGSEIRLITW
ncbi:MAG: hypothetical protein WBN70_06995 [Polyangiales bacterium]